MPENQIANKQKTFEQIKHTENGTEFWFARELMPMLGYKRWEDFHKLVQKTKESDFEDQTDHIRYTPKLIKTGKGATRETTDYQLSRFACYKIAMFGKTAECVESRTYFATQTRKQELLQEAENNQKRLENREKLTENRKKLRDEVYTRGVNTNNKFAKLEDNINLGLYTQTTKAVKKQKNIPNDKPLDDFTSNVELLSKSLSMEMTKINVNNKNLIGLNPICKEGKENADEIRKSLLANVSSTDKKHKKLLKNSSLSPLGLRHSPKGTLTKSVFLILCLQGLNA